MRRFVWCFPLLTIAFICWASYSYLYVDNADVFYLAQLRSLFVEGRQFFDQCMTYPGGLLMWCGLYLTQFFYEPAVGITLLTLLWVVIFMLLWRGLRIPNHLAPLAAVPVIALMVSTIDLGYWVYYLTQQGYFFRETLGVLIAVALIIGGSCKYKEQAKAKAKAKAIALFPLLLYPFIGY